MIQGDIAAYFESGNTPRSVETISYNVQDPGGKSYGKFQLSVRTGTLKKYIAWSKFNEKFKYANPGSSEFDTIWVQIAKDHTQEFEEDQHEFISITHYLPVKRYAKALGFDVENFAIGEALFSIGVQHGGFKSILNAANALRTCAKPSVKEDIENLYKARKSYVNKINLPKNIVNALLNRYNKEAQMVTNLCTAIDTQSTQSLQCTDYAKQLSLSDIQSV